MDLDLSGPTGPTPGFNVLTYRDPEHWYYMLIGQNMHYRAKLQAVPNPILFTNKPLGGVYYESLTLTNLGVRNLIFRSVDLEGDGYAFVGATPLKLSPGEEVTVYIRFTPTEWNTLYPGQITFVTNSKIAETIVYIVGNTAEQPGQLYFDPDPIYVDVDSDKGQLYFDPDPLIVYLDVGGGQLYFDPDPLYVELDIGGSGEGNLYFDPDPLTLDLDITDPTDVVSFAPTSIGAIPGVLSASVVFAVPSNAGFAKVSSYTVTASPGGATITGPLSPILFPGLSSDTTYTFTVVANGVLGPSPASVPSNAVTPESDSPPIPDLPTPAAGRLATYGNQIIDSDNRRIRLRSVNWFGAEGGNYNPHGTWQVRWKDLIDQMIDMGFNCIRLPFSGEFRFPGVTPPPSSFRADLNPEFVGKTSLEIFDLIIDYAGNRGMYVVLDHHRRSAGTGADGSPIDAYGYDLATWISTWTVMATRYKDNKAVIGADIHNEPHDLSWNTWASYSEQCGNAIHEVAPDWLIFVEGVGAYAGENYWWGGMLKGVATRPVVLTQPNRLVYSPHEYAQSVGFQSWLAYDGSTPPSGWPNNLYAVWDNAWGFIFRQNIAPLWIGEFGGHFGVNGSGSITFPHGAYETQWANNLVRYYNGFFTASATQTALTGTDVGISFAYWSLNPNSGDTGGLLQDDWETQQTVKLSILKPLLPVGPWRTKGNQILDNAGLNFRIKAVTWYGAESSTHVPEGLTDRPYTEIIDLVKSTGFNTIRLPFGGSFSNPTLSVTSSAVSATHNSTLVGLTAWQVMDKIIEYAASVKVYVILDYHNASDTGGVDGGPTAGAGVANWQTTWQMMANRYKAQVNVMGADLYNEPVNYSWNAWATLAEQIGNAIHVIAPQWLIFVEGVGNDGTTTYSDGGLLKGVATRPIVLNQIRKVVYSPHDYGQTVAPQPWLAAPGNVVPGYPDNLFNVFKTNWGFIHEQNIAPVWLGEFGASLGLDEFGVSAAPYSNYATEETQWLDTLASYLNGNYTGTSPALPDGKKGINFGYFCLNNSVVPLGLIKTGTLWSQMHAIKLSHLSPLFNDGENFVPVPVPNP